MVEMLRTIFLELEREPCFCSFFNIVHTCQDRWLTNIVTKYIHHYMDELDEMVEVFLNLSI